MGSKEGLTSIMVVGIAVFIGVDRPPGTVLSAFCQGTRFVPRAAPRSSALLSPPRSTAEEADAGRSPGSALGRPGSNGPSWDLNPGSEAMQAGSRKVRLTYQGRACSPCRDREQAQGTGSKGKARFGHLLREYS